MSEENTALTVDLDDPTFQETTNYDPTQDINARIVPPELDTQGNVIDYMIKLSIGENKDQKKMPYASTTKKGDKFLGIVVKAQVVAPGQVYDKGFVGFPFNGVTTVSFNGTNSMADLARVLGKQMPPKLSQKDQAAYVMSLLENEPMLVGRIQWSAYCSTCEEEIGQLKGEKNWPEKKDEQGKLIGHQNVMDCPMCHNELMASPKIKKLQTVK